MTAGTGRGRLVVLLAWVLVAGACSTAVWTVIRTAGADVTSPTAIPAPVLAATTSPAVRTSGPRPHSRPRHRARPTPSPATSRPVSGRPSVPGSTSAPSVKTSRPSPAPRPSPRRTSSSSTTQSGTQTPVRQRTWQGDAGSVTVSCRGATIDLRGAQPNAGWSVEVGNRGPEEVEVSFHRGDGGAEVAVHSRCRQGTPRFSTESDS